MAKTSIDARQHIKEWGLFFAGAKTVTETLINEFLKNRQKNKYLRQSLNRFIKNSLITKQDGKFLVTKKGIMFFDRLVIKDEFKNIKSWDGKWRLVTFDVPVNFDKKRYILRSLLKDLGFYQLQKSVWIYPDYLAEKFWKLLVDLEINQYCKIMLVEFLENDEDIKRHFKRFTTSNK
ncbi:MAG: hypothetical protein QMD65_00675 [Patescibacteria group bacterium]|nr:hypothetical protein [Patescibacteria group bacterium]